MRKILSYALPVFMVFMVLSACAKKQLVKSGTQFNAQDSFNQANALFDKKDYDKAITLFNAIKVKDVSGNVAPLAALRVADCYDKQGEPDSAIDAYRKFLETYPDHTYAPYAQYRIAMIYFSQIQGYDRGYGAAKKALEEFRNLKALYPRNPYKDSVELHISRCRYIMASYEFMVGKFYYKKKAWRGALGRFEGIVEDYPDFVSMPEVLYDAASSCQALGETGKAVLYIGQLEKKWPDSMYAAKAKKEKVSGRL
ncbi:MAG: outer membrane protein assembly factor BamD [Nitrospiraceae bacterium]|nr:outer membrane protein assembly factor BamD [Nitrospiraceae bacterium]